MPPSIDSLASHSPGVHISESLSNSVINLTNIVQSKPLDLGISERYRNEHNNSSVGNYAHEDQFTPNPEKEKKCMQTYIKYKEENTDHRQSLYTRKSVLTTRPSLADTLDRHINNSVGLAETSEKNSSQPEVEIISNSDEDANEIINNVADKSPKSVQISESNILSNVESDETIASTHSAPETSVKSKIEYEKLTSISCKFIAKALLI